MSNVEQTWPAPPSYYLTGGPWTAPRIPAPGERKRHSFDLPLSPEGAFPATASSTAPPRASPSPVADELGLPSPNAGIKDALVELFGKGGADIGRVAELFLGLLEDLAGRKPGYTDRVQQMQTAFAQARGLLEFYHPQLAVFEVIESLRAQSAEREAATALLLETVASVKVRIKGQAESLLAQEK